MRRCLLALVGVAALWASAGDAWGQVQYALTGLGPTYGGSYATGINDNGQIVGAVGTAYPLYEHAFLYGNGSMQDLGTFGGWGSNARGINNSGQVVGAVTTGSGAYPFLYSNGTVSDLGTLGGSIGYAVGINNTGQVVGYSSGHAFLYSSGTMQDLGTLGGAVSVAYGVNNSGQVVGYSYASGEYEHAFLWSGSGAMQDLNSLVAAPSGWALAVAYAINDGGQVVGYADAAGFQAEHAFLYGGGVMRDLGTFGSNWSYAYGVNNNGQVVGYSYTSGDAEHAFLWSGSGPMQDLNSLVAAPSGWALAVAYAINDRGQVVGSGTNPAGQTEAFLLTPTFTAFQQRNALWGSDSYAGGSSTIAASGCAVSSLAMVLTGAGVAEDPGSLNSLLTANGGYSGLAVNWVAAVNAVAAAAGIPASQLHFHYQVTSSTAALASMLSNGPVVVGVNYSKALNAWTHFVVVTAVQGTTFTIADPWSSSNTTLAAYGAFQTRGYVSDPTDVSSMDISVVAAGSGVNLLLTDPQGNKTGIDSSGAQFGLIPNSVHFNDAIAAPGQSPTSVTQFVDVSQPASGGYGIQVSGIGAGSTPYELLETAFAPDGTQLWSNEISGAVAAGSADQYSVPYAAPEPSSLALLAAGAVALVGCAWRRRRRAT